MANMKKHDIKVHPVTFKAGESYKTKSVLMEEFVKYFPKKKYKEVDGKIRILREIEITISVKSEVRFGDEQ